MTTAITADLSDIAFSAEPLTTESIAADAVSETSFKLISTPVISRTPALIAQGDWDAYYSQTAACHGSAELIDAYGSVADFKRHCARAYLGSNARLEGSRYSHSKPFVLTDAFVKELRLSNQTRRDVLHPTLAEELRKLTAEKVFAAASGRIQRTAPDSRLLSAAKKITVSLPLATA